MQDMELIALWRSYDRKLEENLRLNRQNAETITLIKIKSLLRSMAPLKIFTVVTGILWVGFLTAVLYGTYHFASPFFWVSILIHVLLLSVVIGIYGYQLVLIYQTDISEALVTTQYRLASLQSTTLLIARLMFIHIPVWCTFCISEKMLQTPVWLSIHLGITIVFFIIAIWLFFNIKIENRDKKWFRMLFSGKDWEPVLKSAEMLKDIKGFNHK